MVTQILKKKKVLCITNVPAPYTVDFYNELGKKVELTILFERTSASNREEQWFSTKENNFKAIYLNGVNVGAEMSICFNITKYLNATYDTVIIANYSSPTGILAMVYLKVKHIPFYIHADGGVVARESWWKFRLKKMLISLAEGYFSSGLLTDKYFQHYGKPGATCYRYPLTSIRKHHLCPNARTCETKNNRKNKEFCSETIRVLFVGSIIPRKGVDVLVKAAQYLSDSIVVNIIGGSPTEDLEFLMKNLGIKNVYFYPFMSSEMILGYMREADLFVFPTRYDIWGLVVNEALSQGLPVITTDKCLAGLELIQDGQNGFIIPSDDPKALAEKIEYLSNNPEELLEMREKCLECIRPYTIENMAAVYAAHIDVICQQNTAMVVYH